MQRTQCTQPARACTTHPGAPAPHESPHPSHSSQGTDKRMFSKKSAKKNLVGLDIGSSSIKAVELSGKPGNLVLMHLGHEALQPDSVVDGQIMELNSVSGTIASVFNAQQIKTERVAAGVSGSSVIVKNILVPPMSDEELEESIDWHAEEHIPFEITD
ncbi:MAG TPA: pilus assembly protein PilM, partial [Pyrinomonadaceae bacterium]|nr:pilus assembly protein PilM [Pyrinomonadaceae bacterium]